MTIRFSLWSGPRNVSTALMYSFAQRTDTVVVDEPFYAHYLKVTGLDHPGRDVVLAGQENDINKVIEEVIFGAYERELLFMKQMAHHLVQVDHAFLADTVNGLLIRDPSEVLRTLPHQIPVPKLEDTALPQQVALHQELVALGQNPPIVDARDLLTDPPGVLAALCQAIGVSFQETMLTWAPGGRPEDGVWAPYWYENVHRSNGFMRYHPKSEPFPPELEPLLEECRQYYDYLYARAVRSKGAER